MGVQIQSVADSRVVRIRAECVLILKLVSMSPCWHKKYQHTPEMKRAPTDFIDLTPLTLPAHHIYIGWAKKKGIKLILHINVGLCLLNRYHFYSNRQITTYLCTQAWNMSVINFFHFNVTDQNLLVDHFIPFFFGPPYRFTL